MISPSLRAFADRAVEHKTIDAGEVDHLRRTILCEGVTSREEADVLIALERAVGASAHPSFVDFMVASIVDYVVWTSRPTGYVSRDDALWLVASLNCGQGPTRAARRIVFAVIQDAEQVDEVLLAFAMRGSRTRRADAGQDPGRIAA